MNREEVWRREGKKLTRVGLRRMTGREGGRKIDPERSAGDDGKRFRSDGGCGGEKKCEIGRRSGGGRAKD